MWATRSAGLTKRKKSGRVLTTETEKPAIAWGGIKDSIHPRGDGMQRSKRSPGDDLHSGGLGLFH